MKKLNKEKIEEVAIVAALIAEHLRLFVSEIIGLTNAPFHDTLDDLLSNYTYQKLAVAMPRGFGKSTHLSVAYPLWEIAKNHDVRILLVSNTAAVSRSFMSEIVGHIERNSRYQLWSKIIDPKRKGVVPRMRARQRREEHWSADSIIIDRDDLKLKDPTIAAVGLLGPILSKRADIIIIDDVVNQENAVTEDQRAKIKDWVYTTLFPVLVPGGRIVCLGNTWHMDDLMSNLLKDPQFAVKRKHAAIIHEATNQTLWEEWSAIHLDESLSPEEKIARADRFLNEHKAAMDEGVDVLWPGRFSYADLYLKRIGNPYSFARMFQCDPSIRPNQKFLEEDINKAITKGKNFILGSALAKSLDIECITSGLDLAISQKDHSDDVALLTLGRVRFGNGVINTGDCVILDIERGKFLPKQVVDMVLHHEAVMRPVGIRVESVGYQEAMSRDLGDYGIPVHSYHTGGEKNDPDIGVNSLAVLLSQGKLVLPFGNDAKTRRLISQLINEMRAYPDGHTGDSLMALWFAYSEMRDSTANRIVVPTVTPIVSPTPAESLKDADQELIDMQESARGGYDPARELRMRLREGERRAQENLKNEELNNFRRIMGGW